MKHFLLFATFALFAGPLLSVSAASPLSVTQGRAVQKVGTRLVDVYYDLSGGVPPYSVTLQGSLDGGVSWSLPVTSVSGHVGTVSTAGTNRLITWDAGADWVGQVSGNVKFRVNVTDSATPIYGDMVRIEGGPFQMGDQSNPLVGDSIELPVHTVQVSTFYMGKYEVSWGLWKQVRDWARQPGRGYTDLLDGGGEADDHPVYSITWYDMVKWCNARTEFENATLGTNATPCYTISGVVYRTGSSTPDCNWSASGYRLPSEAEWEKAARGMLIGQNFPLGNSIGHSKANYYSYNYSYEDDPKNQGYHPVYEAGFWPYTAPVTSFAPNGYGLYNMSGNVSEWCWDLYGSYTAGLQTDPHGASSGWSRVLRGGSWRGYAEYCRVADRSSNGGPDDSYNGIGFRTARSSVP